uniref:inositol-1,3,4-trisphosphate 5/6-kinase n=1 Tax=Lates calcarifer TaxID=8187 RepID=A0A4W6DF46_LATCA
FTMLQTVILRVICESEIPPLSFTLQTYVSTHPSTVLLDPLPAMTRLLDRFASYRIMSKLHNSLRDWRICSPPYLEVHRASDLPSIQQAVMAQGLSFPLICKTRVATWLTFHEMSLIFSAGSLADIHPPCVLQSFVNHGAVLHQGLCVLVSLCLQTGKPIFFNSHQVSKPESSSDLTAVTDAVPPSSQLPGRGRLVRELRVQLGMALFGVDVIINIHTHTLTVIRHQHLSRYYSYTPTHSPVRPKCITLLPCDWLKRYLR